MTSRATAPRAREASALSHAAGQFAVRRNRAATVPSVLLVLGAMLVAAAAPTVAAANTTGLSNGIVQRAGGAEPSAVFGYDPSTGKWIELGNVTWNPVSSAGHSGYLIEAAAPKATAISTFKVVIAGTGLDATSVEVYMTPVTLLRLTAGQTTRLRINLF